MTQPTSPRVLLKMEYEPGITEQFRTLKSCVAAVVYASKAGLEGCAQACLVSPSTLCKMLNEHDNEENRRHLPIDFLPIIIQVTKDYRPLLWLGAKFMPNEEQRREAVIGRVEQMLAELTAALPTLRGRDR
jgi:hypothetical protein